jgi:PAS domain S-box-containing protein
VFLLLAFGSSIFAYVSDNNVATFFAGLSLGLAIVFALQNLNSSTNISAKNYEHLKDALDALGEGVLLFDKNNKIVLVNKRIREISKGMKTPIYEGMTREEMVLNTIEWVDDPFNKQRLEKELVKIKQNTLKSRKNMRLKLPNGRNVVFNETYTHDRGTIIIFRDVTSELQRRADTEFQSELLNTVYSYVPMGICVFNADYNIVSWNERYIDIMEIDASKMYSGIPARQHLINTFNLYVNVGDTAEAFADKTLQELVKHSTSSIERITNTGRIVEIYRVQMPDGGTVCTYSDITLQKSSQLILKESESRYRKMVELSPDAIFVQKDGLIIYANQAAIDLLSAKDLHDVVGNQIAKYFPYSDHLDLSRHFGPAEKMSAGENVSRTFSKILRPMGGEIDVEVEAAALLYGDKPVMQIIARDISAQKHVELLLKQAKEEAEYASQLKGTFLANMSHELRTPLNAIIGFSDIIRNEIYGSLSSPKYIEYASDIFKSGNHLLDLINDILDLSKIEAGGQSLMEDDLEILPFIEDCIRGVEPQRQQAGVDLKVSIAADLPCIFVDPRLMKQVLLNLMSNAIKFTPKSGQVEVSSYLDVRGGLVIAVEDTGIGIRKDDIQKALTPFVQIDSELSRKYQGTGLGLPLSKNLVELHNATFSVESTFGVGTKVIITLPVDRVNRSAA